MARVNPAPVPAGNLCSRSPCAPSGVVLSVDLQVCPHRICGDVGEESAISDFRRNLTLDVPALTEPAGRQRVPVRGKDFKTGRRS